MKCTPRKLLFVFSVVSLFLLGIANPVPEVKALSYTTVCFTSSSSDGGIFNYSSVYVDARTSNVGTTQPSQTEQELGQRQFAGYFIFRMFLYFDTSAIPTGATISNVILSLNVQADYSTTDFNVQVVNGQPTYPHDPLESADYYYTHYSGNGGSRSTSQLGVGYGYYWNITLTSNGRSWINEDGTTKLCLRSSRDINGDAPTGNEFVRFYCSEKGESYAPRLYVTYEGCHYHFHGLYSEDSGLQTGVVDVTAYFGTAGNVSENFQVNNSYTYSSNTPPLYFHVELGSYDREYWVTEETETIYLFNSSLTGYTVQFLDLAGVLDEQPYIEAKRRINGSLMTVEKRRIDIEDKVFFSLKPDTRYTITIGDGTTYTYGEVLFGSDTTVELTLKGIQFPKETLLIYKYVRIYGSRVFDTPTGSITITYQDTLNQTTSVVIVIKFSNGSTVHTTTKYNDTFSYQWSNAVNNTDYYVQCTINHERYGSYGWNQVFSGDHAVSSPWGLGWLGGTDSLPFDTNILLPCFLIVFAGGCFSMVNAYVGAFMMVITASILTFLGWISIPASALVTGFSLAVLMGLTYAKAKELL